MSFESNSARHERARQYWLSLLAGRAMPTIADLSAERLSEFKNHSFLIAMAGHGKSPVVSFAGKEIFAGEGEPALKAGVRLETVASDSLLSALEHQFTQIQNNCEPLNFDVGALGTSGDLPSKGSLMPFGAAGSVQFIWGVLADKEVEVAATPIEYEQDLSSGFDAPADEGISFDSVSDGDGTSQFDEGFSQSGSFEAEEAFSQEHVEPEPEKISQEHVKEESFAERERLSGFDAYADTYEGEAYHISEIATEERSDLGTGQIPTEIYLGFDDRADTFEGEAYEMTQVVTEESSIVFYDETTDFDSDEPDSLDGFAGSIAEAGEDTEFDGFVDMGDVSVATEKVSESIIEETEEEEPEEESFEEESLATEAEEQVEEENEVPFFNVLADGRTAADSVVHVDQRSRLSLYDVLAKAYALYEESQGDRDTYLSILKATGIREQLRAPFTPIIKLVFGKDFDKTRITEYAAALSFAKRNGQTSETVSGFLANHPGGIKGCVQAERIAKREDKGIAGDVALETAKEKLRGEKPIGKIKAELVGDDEFVLLLGRRGNAKGVVEIIKIVDEKRNSVDPIIKRATKPNS